MYMVWLVSEGRTANLYFRRSMDEGRSWERAQQISADNADCYPAYITAHKGILHLVWFDYGETIDGEMYYVRSLDSGVTWEEKQILVADANSARYPLVSCKDNNVYMVWQDVENKIFFKSSSNRGITWTNEISIGKAPSHSCFCYPPTMSIVENDLVVVWTDYGEDKKGVNIKVFGVPLFKSSKKLVSSVICRTSSDNGRTWRDPRVLTSCTVSEELTDEIDNPMMLSDGALSYLFWLDRRNIILGEIFYARFDHKTHKGPIDEKRLYATQKRSPKRPSVAFDHNKNIHCTWASFFNGTSEIYYSKIDREGNILKEKIKLTADTARYHNPVITRTQSGLMHILWFHETQDKEKWSTIFMKTSADNGLTWDDWKPQTKEM